MSSTVQGLPLQNFVLQKIDRKTKSQVLGTASSFLFAPLKKTSVSCSDVSILCCLVFSFLVMVVSMKLLFLAPSCLLRQNRRRKKFLSKLWCLTKKGHSCCCHPQIQFTYLTFLFCRASLASKPPTFGTSKLVFGHNFSKVKISLDNFEASSFKSLAATERWKLGKITKLFWSIPFVNN